MKKELITLDNLEFILVTTKVKNINLRVLHDGTVRVSAPVSTNKDEIISFVKSKKQWILKHSDKHYLKEGEFFYLGQRHNLKELGKISLLEFYYKEADRILKERYNHLSNRLVDNPPKLIIRRMKGKYGYYTKSSHEIFLNLWLIMVPVECIDFVITHELMHTIYFNHGKSFHKAVQKFIPNEKELKDQLSKYILW
ncbi:MAG: DUF45 domain-containing protein [Lachnospiraceae bacterium]|nr:DUF45 domain-containing protein [Lachnospiraceae bacterium]